MTMQTSTANYCERPFAGIGRQGESLRVGNLERFLSGLNQKIMSSMCSHGKRRGLQTRPRKFAKDGSRGLHPKDLQTLNHLVSNRPETLPSAQLHYRFRNTPYYTIRQILNTQATSWHNMPHHPPAPSHANIGNTPVDEQGLKP